MTKTWGCLLAAGMLGAVSGTVLESENAAYHLDDATGAVTAVVRKSDGRKVVTGVGNRYFLLGASGDRKGTDRTDTVTERHADNGVVTYLCANPRLPGVTVAKRYAIVNGGLRREMTFTNADREVKFLQIFTDCRFAPEFLERAYYFGAGYLGPFLPAAKVRQPTRVESYVQSSKGMVLVNADPKRESFAHFRVKLNGTTVFPWWQSTIGSYREKNDRLHYLPDGWRMALGTVDLPPDGGKFTYTDQLVCFPGDLFDFFETIYARDPDFAAAYAKIPPSPPELLDVFVETSWGFEPYLRYLAEISGEGLILNKTMICADWADYRWADGFNSYAGGFVTAKEIQTFIDGTKAISPRIRNGFHTITVAGTLHSPIFKEHPEYFRKFDRAGDLETHFPGLVPNYQTMINRPEVRKFIVDSVCAMAEQTGIGFVYQDEAQYQNTINWQTGELIRDDHSVPLWDALRRRVLARGKFVYFNGSGNPYADVNYMECPKRMLTPGAWREFAGVGLGLEMVSRMRPGSRITLLYMNDISDYFGRVLSHGWIPAMGDVGREHPGVLTVVRAAYEIGKTLPCRANYSPDWKRDPAAEWESYSVRRLDSQDTILSFINRTRRIGALPLTLDLSSLGYPAGTRLNVWAYRIRYPRGAELNYQLSDRELRDRYRETHWSDAAAAVPELIYSGDAAGTLNHEFPAVGVNDLVQYVISPAPAAVYTVDHQPGTYFFTKRRGVEVKPDGTVTSTRENAEILLADREAVFTDVRLDGVPAVTETVDAGGLLMTAVPVPSGTHRLTFRRVERPAPTPNPKPPVVRREGNRLLVADAPADRLYALVRHGRTCLVGTSPLTLPEQFPDDDYLIREAGSAGPGTTLRLTGGKNSRVILRPYPDIPAETLLRKEDRELPGGVRLLRSGTFIGAHRELRNLQRDLPPVVVRADAETLTLTAGTTRRNDTLDINHYAGFELSGAETVQLKLTHNFDRARSFFKAGSHVWLGGEKSKIDFSGIVADYRVGGKYVKRAIFSWGVGTRYLQNRFPSGWGTERVQDVYIRLGNLLEKPETVFSLDLKQYAPEGWDGVVFLAAGNNHILADRMFTLTLLKFNDRTAGDFLTGRNMANRRTAGVIPEPLHLPKVKTAPRDADDASDRWAKITELQPYGATEELTQRTTAFWSYDQNFLYAAVRAEETARPVRAPYGDPYRNDCVDLFLEGVDGKLAQISADAKGRHVILPAGALPGCTVRVKPLTSGGYDVFAAIPWEALGVKAPVPGNSLRVNLCRSRIGKGGDRASWAPVRSESGLGFRDVEKYGRIVLGFPVSGMGRFDEVELESKQ